MRDRGAKQRNGETAKGRNGEAASGAHRGARLRNSRLYSQSYWWISTHREQGRFAAEPRAQRSAAEIVFRIARSFFRGVAHRGPRLGSVSVQSAIIRANTIRLAKRLLPFRSLAPLWAPLAPSPFRPHPPGLHLIPPEAGRDSVPGSGDLRPRRCLMYYATELTDRYEPATG